MGTAGPMDGAGGSSEGAAAVEAWDLGIPNDNKAAGTGVGAEQGLVYMVESGDTGASIKEKID